MTGSIDELRLERFEAAWFAGAPEPIEDHLPPTAHPDYLPTLEELVSVELEFRWKGLEDRARGGPRIEDFLERFPALNDSTVLLRLLQQEYRTRHLHGDRPGTSEYLERFPRIVRSGSDLEGSLEIEDFGPQAEQDITPPGTRLGRYKLSARHARGGFGFVWRAMDEQLGRMVALKQLGGHVAWRARTRERFLAEAKIAARLEHPGVVPVYELCGEEDQLPYYTMKLVHGETLTECIRRYHDRLRTSPEGPVEELRLLNALLSVARTMAYAHRQGVLHRDLKPDNIVLGEYGESVILDWGLAKVVGGEPEVGEDLPGEELGASSPEGTHEGTVMGTPVYMSPEQAAGDVEEVDQRSHVYSLGAILYQVLTGECPFSGASSEEVLAKVRTEDPRRPRDLLPSIPRPLEAICLRAMAKRPSARYAEVAALTSDLERYLADERVSAWREPLRHRFGRWVRRHPALASAGAVALVLGLLGTIGVLTARSRSLGRLRIAGEADRTIALSELRAGRFASAALILEEAARRVEADGRLPDLQADLEARTERAERLLDFQELDDRAWFLAGEEYDEDTLEVCSAALARLGVEDWEDWPAELPADDLLEEQRRELASDVHRLLLLQAVLQAKPALLAFLDPETSEDCRKALRTLELATQHHETQTGRLLRAFCRIKLGEADRSELTAFREPQGAADHFFFGFIHLWIDQFPDDAVGRLVKSFVEGLPGIDTADPLAAAERYFRGAVDIEPRHFWNHYMLAWALTRAGDQEGSILAFGTCIALRPDRAAGYTGRANEWLVLYGRTGEDHLREYALADAERALRVEALNPWTHWSRAALFDQLGRRGDALSAIQRAMELDRPDGGWFRGRALENWHLRVKAWETDEPENHELHATRAWLALALGEWVEAEEAAARALELAPDLPRALVVRGELALLRGDETPALRDFERALEQPPALFLAASGVVRAHVAGGDAAAAATAAQAALEVAETGWQREMIRRELDRLEFER